MNLLESTRIKGFCIWAYDAMSLRRTPHALPTNPLVNRGDIFFRHPRYLDADNNILIRLARVDPDTTHTDVQHRYGVFYSVALLACQVIAGNAFNGYLEDSQYRRVAAPDAGETLVLCEDASYSYTRRPLLRADLSIHSLENTPRTFFSLKCSFRNLCCGIGLCEPQV